MSKVPVVRSTEGFLQLLQTGERLDLKASTTTEASLNLPHGAAPTAPVNGDLWTTTTSMYARINGATVDLVSGGGSGDSVSFSVTQTTHGFVVGNVLTLTGGTWALADRDAASTVADAVVSLVTDSNTFTATIFGVVTGTTGQWDAQTGDTGGLVAGEYYWLSSTAGALTKTQQTSGLLQCLGVAKSATVLLLNIGEAMGAGSGGLPAAGANKQIQYNDGGIAGAEAGFEYDNATNTLSAGSLALVAGTTSLAPLLIPQGVAPTSPVNGNVWTTTTSIYARINGITVDLAGGGGSGTATIDFGAWPGSNEASIAVTGQASILTTSKVRAFIMGDDSSGAHTALDHRYIALLLALSCGTPTAGVGFTIYGRSLEELQGTFAIRFVWTD